ncbi:hypothetical protein R5R35_010941 [Gryllus longicercus]
MAESDVWELLNNDDFLRQFVSKEPKPDSSLAAVSQGLAVAEQIKKLTEVIVLLDKELQKQVLENHEDLLSQATWVEKLEGVLSSMLSHVQCLLSAVERLRGKIVEPFDKIAMQTLMLSRLHATSDLLRRVARIQHVCKRLNTLMHDIGTGNTSDLVKAAQSLYELNQLAEDVDLSGLEVLEEDERSIRIHKSTVEKRAKSMLNEGLLNQNQSQVMTAVQVFYCMGVLSNVISQVATNAEQQVTKSIKDALDVQFLTQVTTEQSKSRGAPGRAAMPSLGNLSMFRSRLWSSLENLFESSIYKHCVQIALLERTLSKKTRDSLSMSNQHSTYLDLLPGNTQNLATNLWNNITTLLAKQLVLASQSTSFLKQTLEGEYPKFLRLYLDLCKKLQAAEQSAEQVECIDTKNCSEGTENTIFCLNREVVIPFENAYLSCSVSRLLDPVNLMFSGENVPSHEEVDSLIRTITSELSVSLVDANLSRTVARNINKTVRLFCLKCEQMVVTGGEATQVIDASTAGQVMNVSIANLLHYLNGQVKRVITNMKNSLPPETMTIVQEALVNTENLIRSIVNPLLSSISDAIEAIILTVHNEDYSMMTVTLPSGTTAISRKTDPTCSLYMKELQAFISRSVNNYLSPFLNQEIVSKSSSPVAGRCLELFLRHTSLVRPLGDGGRMKLAADFAQMELAVTPLCRQVAELGQAYKTLRAFRPLLFMTPEHVASCSAVGEVIPYSLVLLSLFSRGPPELPSPHQSANWSISRFSQWMDSHPSEQERLEIMSGALQRYQQTIRQRGETKFHDVYPVMIDILERGMGKASATCLS